MNQERHSIPSEIADEVVISEVRQLLAEQNRQSPESITEDQINEYLQLFLTDAENYLEKRCIHTLFEQQVEQTPEQVALLFREQSLTYAELNVRVNQMAHYLRQRGVGPEVLVGICMSRSVELIVGLLGVLKAGGAYIPLDPNVPKLRLKAMLADAQPTILLTQEHLIAYLGEDFGEIIALERDWSNICLQETDNLTLLTSPQSLAYVIYSSGRGILVEHQGVCNRLQWLQDEFSLSSSDAVLHKASLALDTSIWEIFWPLLYGGRLVIASADNQDELTYLNCLIAEQQVSIAHFVPSELVAFIESCNRNSATQLSSLRYVLCSGEPLQRPLVDKFFQHFTCDLYNLYGPPEAATEVTAQACQPGNTRDVVPIGHPTHMSVYVLDKYLQLLPVGVAGEIYIAGEGLARGYLHDSEETSGRFVKNPFSEMTDGCLFRTGDRGRWLSDGTLELLGSTARHAWIKGFRILLNDVEAALLDHPAVEDCVVLARETETLGQELIAYIVLSDPFVPEQLASHLQTVLPTTMLPSVYVPVSTVPLTITGQVDEQALTSLEVIDSDLVQRWEEQLRSLPEINQVAVVVQEETKNLPPLHLSDLLPDWKVASATRVKEPVAASVDSAAVQEESQPKPLAISHGGLLREEPGVPTTLPEALQRAALQATEKGITYLQSDGSEFTQSYAALLEEAQRILSGLRKLRLKPQDKVIFQLDSNQDFIAAFWGCVLGGFVPVPIAIAPTYKESNSTVNKLHHAWQMLERPIILTSQRLASAFCSLSELLPLEDFRVETVDELRGCEPDQNWHVSQPEDLALLMLTSGSTGMPKAVMLSARNLLSRSLGSVQMNNFSSLDVTLNWMSLDHVAGLIYFHIRDVYLGCQQIHAPTEIVLQDPLKWLDWIDRFRVTITFAPNFAFSLVNDHAEAIGKRRWDLSSIRFILNGAEAISAKTARRFLELLAPHKLPATTMHPAWGMAETSSGVTYSNGFSLDSTTDDDSFVEVGTPIPGFEMRIVNSQERVVEEDTIGRLQVKGLTLTSGYYQNPKLNREVFTNDGWFNTGDLGFLHEGRLTIAGRAKDVIIVNGVNYYSHEIEAVVEGVEGVEVSYTAACAVRDPSSDTDKLAIFFNTALSAQNRLLELLKEIRASVVQSVGVNPTYLIPVEKEAIPKTSIGKIQRSQLSQRFVVGEFDSILKQIDIYSGNANTLPNWFYRQIWRPKAAVSLATQPTIGRYLVFLDQLGLGKFLCAELGKLNCSCVSVETGSDFAKLSTKRYRINPKHPEHYRQLLVSLSEDNISIDQILHLWTYEKYVAEVSSLEALEQSQNKGVYSLLFLVQALTQSQNFEHPVQLYVISSHSQPTSTADEIAYEKAPLLGLLKTISQEMPGLNCRHVDLPVDRVEVNASYILQEIRAVGGNREMAYRNGQRLIPRLEKVDLRQEKTLALPFKYGGMYLVTGGLGGVGVEIAKYLLKHYQARLLLVGRTPLPKRITWEARLKQVQAVQQRIEAYLSLEKLGGEILYKAVDICDFNQLQQVVDQAKSHWQCELDGVVHLAAVYQEHLLVEETWDSLAATLRPKVSGTWVLHQLLKNQPNSIFISFSSLLSYFGGAMVGAYAAANRFLDYFAHYQKYQCSLRSYCFNWSTWDEVGISQGYQGKDALRIRGYQSVSVRQGLNSLLAGLYHDQAQLLVGLNGSKNHVRRHTETKSDCLQKLCVYFTAATKSVPVARLQALEVRDRFGTRSTCNFIQIQEMPLLPDGTVNRSALFELEKDIKPQMRQAHVMPKTEVEKTIASIWQEVLPVNVIDIHDNFFDLGGSSLLVAQVTNKLREVFKREISITEMFQNPTIMSMTKYLGKESNEPFHPEFNKSKNRGEQRRKNIRNKI